jgi:hypothetical protein
MKPHMYSTSIAAIIIAAGSTTAAHANSWTLTYELPGIQSSSATFFSSGVETFDSRTVGTSQSFSSNFGGTSYTGSYAGVQIKAADQYGGAGGTGRYAVNFTGAVTVLTLNQDVNYFGYWLSALDAGNVVTFFDGTTQVGQFNAGTVFGSAVTGNSSYYGNPNSPFLGFNSVEPYAFVNFYATGSADKFNKIIFSETQANSGYESDNHTIGIYKDISGIPVVPEPSSWLLFLSGALVLGLRGSIKRAVVSRQIANHS